MARTVTGVERAARDDGPEPPDVRAVYDACRDTIERLRRDGALVPGWPTAEAADLLWTMLSIRNWESLTRERGWSVDQYVDRMQDLTKRVFVRGSEVP